MVLVLMLTVMCHMFSQEFTFSDAVIRSIFKNVLCSVNMQCVHVLCERGYCLKTDKVLVLSKFLYTETIKLYCNNVILNLELFSLVVVFMLGFFCCFVLFDFSTVHAGMF